MKKLTLILTALLASMFLMSACSEDNSQSETLSKKINNDTKSEEKNEVDGEIPVYQIGETAVIKNDKFDLEYEVTVNSFEITKEVDGVPLEELVTNLEEDDEDGFLSIDVTYKNISDEAYVPNEKFLSYFGQGDGGGGSLTDFDDMFFPELEKELAPGEEITGKLVYISANPDYDYYTLTYEPVSDNETWFHLPNPNQ